MLVQVSTLRKLKWMIGIALAILISFSQINFAKNKLFWFDEAYDMQATCPATYQTMLTHGAPHQCSPPPLFHVLQKFIVQNLVHFDASILVSYRFVSLVSSFVLILALWVTIHRYFGFTSALVALALVNGQSLFHHYAAESRPYLLWLFIFTVSALYCFYLCLEPEKKLQKINYIFLGLCWMALCTVASPGLLQTLVFASILVLRRSINRIQIALLALISAAIGYFYALHSCLGDNAGAYDLLLTKSLTLVIDPLKLLWPTSSLLVAALNIFSVLGLIFFLGDFLKSKRTTSFINDTVNGRSPAASSSLGSIVFFQILLSLVIGAIVATRHHYFLKRLFIYLIPCHALFAVLGWKQLEMFFLRHLSEKHIRIVQTVVSISLIFEVATSAWIGKYMNYAEIVSTPQQLYSTLGKPNCTKFAGSYKLFAQERENPTFLTNFIVMYSLELDRCGWEKKSEPVNFVKAISDESSNHWYSVITQESELNSSKMIPLKQCGMDVVL